MRKYCAMAKSHDSKWKHLASECSSINSRACLALLKAEKESTKGNSNIVQLYRDAIPLLQEGKFYWFEAIAHERLAEFLKGDSQTSTETAKASYQAAIDKYAEFGASVKVSLMKARLS